MSSLYFKRFILLFQICIIGSGVFSANLSFAQSRPEPEEQTGYYEGLGASGKEIMAVTANPHATRAAYDVLKGGGNPPPKARETDALERGILKASRT